MFKIFKKIINKLRPLKPLYVAYDSGGNDKPTIILLHGIAATSSTWEPIINGINVNDYRVIALDLLGFGLSPKPIDCEYSVNDHVAYVRKTIKKLKIRKPYRIVGHSMGSIIAAKYCLYYPSEIETAFLLSPPIYISGDETQTAIARRQTDFFLIVYNFIAQKKNFTITYSQHLRNLLRLKSGMEVNEENWNSFRLSLNNTIIHQDTYQDIVMIKKPVKIIYGSMDEFLVQESINNLVKLNHVTVTRLLATDHSVTGRFAKEAIAQITAN